MESFGSRLLRDVGGKLLQPGRMSTLSMLEEEARVKASWKDFDAALWLAAFGEVEDLAKFVANPVEFSEERAKLVIGFSDQIPVWVKIGRSKQVFCAREVQPRKTTADFRKIQAQSLRIEARKKIEAKFKKDMKGDMEEEQVDPELADLPALVMMIVMQKVCLPWWMMIVMQKV